jgi:hypothetical protein
VLEDTCPAQWTGTQVVVTLPNEIDVSNASQITEDLLWLINRGATVVIVEFPHADLTATNGARGKSDPEYELLDTGVFDGNRRIPLDWTDLAGRGWRLTDLLRESVFDREGDDLASPGLFVALEPWQFHLLALT